MAVAEFIEDRGLVPEPGGSEVRDSSLYFSWGAFGALVRSEESECGPGRISHWRLNSP